MLIFIRCMKVLNKREYCGQELKLQGFQVGKENLQKYWT